MYGILNGRETMKRDTISKAVGLVGLLVASPATTYAQSIAVGHVMYIAPEETQLGCSNALKLAATSAGESISAFMDGSDSVRIDRSDFSILLSCYYYEISDIVIVTASVAGATHADMVQGVDAAKKLAAALEGLRPW